MTTFDKIQFKPSASLLNNLAFLAVAGTIVSAAGLYFAPERGWASLLVATQFLLGLGLAGILFIALLAVSNAG